LNQTNALLILAAGTEVATGLVLISVPSLFTQLLFGRELVGAGLALAPLAGFGLLSLAWACWPSKVSGWSAIPALRAFLLFSLLSAGYLVYLGVGSGEIGILLWPAVVFHGVLALLLAWVWLRAQTQRV
jgi:hypothetical protein